MVLALALEQWRPSAALRWVRADVVADELVRRLEGGQRWHSWLAWSVFVIGATMLAWLAGRLLGGVAEILEAVFMVAVLYQALGFHDVRRRFATVHQALAVRRLDLAGAALAAWIGTALPPDSDSMPATTPETIARQAIERGVVDTERCLFGVVFWFAVLPGACGAVLYRAADYLAQRWGDARAGDPPRHGGVFARQM
ncbi:MAG: CobD/CbiB family protein, partial [Proteobacteria bacterium]|nr:CobD/CbiB family protein [Burkholderiales bacterium]